MNVCDYISILILNDNKDKYPRRNTFSFQTFPDPGNIPCN